MDNDPEKPDQLTPDEADAIRRAILRQARSSVGSEVYGGKVGRLEPRWFRRPEQIEVGVYARLVGFSEEAVTSWEAGGPVGVEARLKKIEIGRLLEALSDMFGPEHLAQWLETATPWFQGSKPIDVIERGESERVWDMLYHIRSGSLS